MSISANKLGQPGTPGAAGAPGSVWRDGSGAPSNGLGIDGDYYLNTANGDVYLKLSGTYSVTGNIKGPDGADGQPGPQGDPGPQGPSVFTAQGEWDSGTNYVPNDVVTFQGSGYYCLQNSFGNPPSVNPTIWQLIAEKGDQGDQGPQGDPGVDGQVQSVNGQTGNVILDKSDIGLDQVDNTSDLDKPISTAVQDALDAIVVTGPSNQSTYFDQSGNLAAVPGWGVNTVTGGPQLDLTQQPDDFGGGTVDSLNLVFDPLQDSPNDGWNVKNWQVNLDPNSSGFDLGTNGNFANLINIGYNHQGTSDVGGLNGFVQNFSLGNGTDPINVKGFGYAFGFGNINANVTISGTVQGYGFQPAFNAASAFTSNANVIAFYDFANCPVEVPGWSSAAFSPNIGSIANNTNYTGVGIGPNITSFSGNAGFTALGIFPNIGTFGTGGFNGISISPNITSVVNATGLYINMDNVTASGTKRAIDVNGDVNINGALAFTGALSMGQLSAFYASNPVDGAGNPQAMHGMITSMTALNGVTVANADAIGVNTAMLITLEDNSVSTSGPFGLGFAALALPCVVETRTGATLDYMHCAAYALNLAGSSTGGTIDEVGLCRTIAIPNGITTINKLKAYKFDLPFGPVGTDIWGLYLEPAFHNWLGGALKIGGTAGSTDVESPGTQLHVEGSTLLDGDIGFFGTAPVSQQTGGVATAGATYTSNEQGMIQTIYDALRTYGLLS